MEITNIRFKKNVQVKPYESEELEVSAMIKEGEDDKTCVETIKAIVYRGLGLDYVSATGNELHTGAESVTITEEPKKAKAVKTVKATKEVKAAKEVKAETAEVVEAEAEAEVVEEKPVKKTKAKTKKAKANKNTVYDRTIQEHRTRLGVLIVETTGDAQWPKNPKLKAIAAKLSNEILGGLDFLDEAGNYCEGFISTVHTEFGVE